MNLSQLKKIRITISLLFFTATIIIFLDISGILQNSVSPYLVYLQFTPSLVKFLTIFSIGTTGFAIITLLTFLFGRVYCSSVCPLGTLQDIIYRISKLFDKKKYFRIIKNFKWIRYSILFVTMISFLAGNLIFLNILDPFSNTGKIFTNIFRPLYILLNNLISFSLEKLNIYFMYPIEIKGISLIGILFSLFVLLVVGIMSYKKGRLFCNSICPVGTLLGIFSKLSLYKISIDKNNCKSCNLCERVCKSGCIDKKIKQIDFERCVNCYNCFTVCPSEGIVYERSIHNSLANKKVDVKKREFISKTFIYLAGLSGLSFTQLKIIPKKESTVPVLRINPVSPPGSLSIPNFTGSCTACHLCVSACPSQVLQPALWEYGWIGILQPRMDYNTSFCNFECVICGDICPNGAILPITQEKKKLTQLGKVTFVKENCIVETEKTECGACSEHCPTKAVKMVPYKNLHLPEIKNEYCVGCGACEFACPTKPYKAIYVDGNPVHLESKRPPEEKIEKEINLKVDFPF
ncbi:MAG TPA: 4Fe-4S binding protein [Ignavibacteriaceae bacterium]|nr:4Fe-4S binding protein [Ignavibacteriaceae bacterium]